MLFLLDVTHEINFLEFQSDLNQISVLQIVFLLHLVSTGTTNTFFIPLIIRIIFIFLIIIIRW
ncbi:hypothetical protein DKK70_00655 [Gilliamella apicola]|uniref:Uncharacterized protein n=1 Tax=Gilliamella apicola TaxID=1196095 RepID=A0A2V4ECM0_9GAMM|nr:hypothetical protein DKK70_00655 [Gilliamella apicola]